MPNWIMTLHLFERTMSRTALLTVPLAAVVLLAGCATTPQPLPFDLVGKGATVHRGLFRPADGSVDVRVNNKVYTGFYVTSVSTARSSSVGFGVGYGGYGRYGYGMYGAYPQETWTTISNNSGKAFLQSADGDKLNCDFMYEGRRLLGECRSPDTGAVYQMVANQAVTNPPPAPSSDAASPATAAPTTPAPPPPAPTK
jgi:hypothetical protein